MQMQNGIGEFVRARRTELGWNQTELAGRTGLTRGHLSTIEAGKIAVPAVDIRRRLAAALNVRHVDLLVAAGELTEDEIDPDIPQYSDPTMDALAQTWPHLDEDRREDLIRFVNRLLEPVSNVRVIRRDDADRREM